MNEKQLAKAFSNFHNKSAKKRDNLKTITSKFVPGGNNKAIPLKPRELAAKNRPGDILKLREDQEEFNRILQTSGSGASQPAGPQNPNDDRSVENSYPYTSNIRRPIDTQTIG